MSQATITREAVETIILGRGAQRIVINPGQVFEFTEAEYAEITAANPKALTEKSVISLDDPNGIDMKKVDAPQAPNQTNAPDASGTTTKGGRKSKAASEDL